MALQIVTLFDKILNCNSRNAQKYTNCTISYQEALSFALQVFLNLCTRILANATCIGCNRDTIISCNFIIPSNAARLLDFPRGRSSIGQIKGSRGKRDLILKSVKVSRGYSLLVCKEGWHWCRTGSGTYIIALPRAAVASEELCAKLARRSLYGRRWCLSA